MNRVASLMLLLGACAGPTTAAGPEFSWAEGKADGLSRGAFVVQQIDAFNAALGTADRTEKFARMSESEFVFFRGTNHLFWADFAQLPELEEFGGEAEHVAFVAGDQHVANFGAFHNDDDRVVFDLNDFDEALLADYQLDLLRTSVSVVLLARENGLSDRETDDAVRGLAEAYLDRMSDVRGNRGEETAEVTASEAFGRLDEFLEDVERRESRLEMLQRWTVLGDAGRTFNLGLDELSEAPEQAAQITAQMAVYGETLAGGLAYDEAYFRIKSVAQRHSAGTGSLGTPRYYVLLEGPSESPDDDVILDVKRQGSPSGHAFIDPARRAAQEAFFESQASRVVIAQRALLTNVDDHLGWMTLSGGDYSVRERSPFKKSFPLEELDSAGRLDNLAAQWGVILANAHARADRDFGDGPLEHSLEAAIDDATDGEHAAFRELVSALSFAYADQVAEDYATFLASR